MIEDVVQERGARPRSRAGRATVGVLAVGAVIGACGPSVPPDGIDPHDSALVAKGKSLYGQHCASCHGAHLEGQPDWRRRRPDGRLPAPPHDSSGHTWHHPNDVLTGIVRHGVVPPWAPSGYRSDMPAFGAVLGDAGIRAVLAYIQSTWPQEVWQAREQMLRNRSG